jgi:hypothetical protein
MWKIPNPLRQQRISMAISRSQFMTDSKGRPIDFEDPSQFTPTYPAKFTAEEIFRGLMPRTSPGAFLAIRTHGADHSQAYDVGRFAS